MSKWLVVGNIVLLGMATGCQIAPEAQDSSQAGVDTPKGQDRTVERIIDGDTIVVRSGELVRLIGIDTPEVDQDACYSEEATSFIRSLIPPGTAVRLVLDVERSDRFGRTLAYVYRLHDGLLINAEIMRAGYAQILTVPPNVAHAEEFLDLQRQARHSDVGLWSACRTGT